jgi:PAS domain-containing protein
MMKRAKSMMLKVLRRPAEPRRRSSGGLSLSELFFITPATDFTTEQVRQAQIDSLVRLLPFTSVINLINAIMVAVTLSGSVPTLQLGAWLGVIAALGAARVVAAKKRRARGGDAAKVPLSSILKGVILAAALWTVPPLLWFDGVGANEKLMIALVVTGMLSGASIVLATVPPAAFAYVWILSLSMFWAELKLGTPLLSVTAIAYGLILSASSLWFVRQFVAHFRAQLELGEKSDMIELLREFDASGSDWLWELDRDFRLTYVSREMVSHLGIKASDLIGVTIQHLLDPTAASARFRAGCARSTSISKAVSLFATW